MSARPTCAPSQLIEGAEGFLPGSCSSAVWSEATETKVPYGVYPIVSAQGKQENRLNWSCRIIGKERFKGNVFMKNFLLIFAVCLFGAGALAQQAFAQQSLGDVARANRAKKHTNSSTVKLDDDRDRKRTRLNSSHG